MSKQPVYGPSEIVYGCCNADLILIRGVPGSGKTTWALKIMDWFKKRSFPCTHLETDRFFANDEGEYKFDPKKLGENHRRCLEAATESMELASSTRMKTIVSNTFTREFEYMQYIKKAFDFDLKVYVIDLFTQYGNVHGVPLEKVNEMTARFVPFIYTELYNHPWCHYTKITQDNYHKITTEFLMALAGV